MDFETPAYPDQKVQVSSWLQAYRDICREIGRLKFCLSKTNVNTKVTIVIDGHEVTKTITEWIERNKKLCAMEKMAYTALFPGTKCKEARIQQTNGTILECKIRYYYDVVMKDKILDILNAEPALIDAKLEMVNAITDLME